MTRKKPISVQDEQKKSVSRKDQITEIIKKKSKEKFLRPEELHDLKGDSSKLVKTTGWTHDYTFETMLDEMILNWKVYYNN